MIRYVLLVISIIFFLVAGSDKVMNLPQKLTSYGIAIFLFYLLSKVVILKSVN